MKNLSVKFFRFQVTVLENAEATINEFLKGDVIREVHQIQFVHFQSDGGHLLVMVTFEQKGKPGSKGKEPPTKEEEVKTNSQAVRPTPEILR